MLKAVIESLFFEVGSISIDDGTSTTPQELVIEGLGKFLLAKKKRKTINEAINQT